MRKPEQTFWRNQFRQFLSTNPDVAYDRIESIGTAVGVPDIHLSMTQRHWIELKVAPVLRGPKATKVDLSHYTERQRAWAIRHGGNCGNVWLLVVVPDWPEQDEYTCYLIPHHRVRNMARLPTVRDLGEHCRTMTINKKGRPFQWPNFWKKVT